MRIVIVHDDPEFRATAAAALQAAGHDILACSGSMAALDALEGSDPFDLLNTRVTFTAGTPNGVALARMAKMKRPRLRILFAAREENREYTQGVGEFLTVPTTAEEVVATAERLLAGSPDS
jgi:DNA-binding NtrC family response regulator